MDVTQVTFGYPLINSARFQFISLEGKFIASPLKISVISAALMRSLSNEWRGISPGKSADENEKLMAFGGEFFRGRICK